MCAKISESIQNECQVHSLSRLYTGLPEPSNLWITVAGEHAP